MCAICGSTSSSAYAPPMRRAKSDSTWYGVARRPYTTRFGQPPGPLADRLERDRHHRRRQRRQQRAVPVAHQRPYPGHQGA